MRTKHLTMTGLLVTVIVVGGYVLYLISTAIPLPGSKFIVMAPYLSMTLSIALALLPFRWPLLWISLVFGAVLSIFSPVMGAAILLAGALSDVCGHLLPRRLSRERRITLYAACYPAWAFVIFIAVTNYLAGNALLRAIGWLPLMLGVLLVYALGLVGAYGGQVWILRRLPPVDL